MSQVTEADPAGQAKTALPLAGIKVLDLSRVLAGPWATMSLADLGAEVWKIENIKGGDDTRAWAMPNYKGVSTYYLCANRGKSSIALDLKHPDGLRIIHELAAQADVVVENFRPGTVKRLKIDYDTLKAINPALIYCSISGYGQTGPEWDRPGYDFVMQAESGLMSITGAVDGGPQRIGVAMTDIVAGMVSVQSILAALYQRQQTGIGQHIDVSLLECSLNTLINVGSGYLNAGVAPKRFGNAHPTVVPYQTCACSDGTFALAVGNDRQFTALCENIVGLPALATDPRYATSAARAVNRDSLLEALSAVFITKTRSHWIEACLRYGVPAGEVKSVAEAFDSPTVRERQVVQTLESDHLGPVSLVRPAQGLAAQLSASYKAPPMLGEDTSAILAGALDYKQDEIEQLIASGVVSQFTPAE